MYELAICEIYNSNYHGISNNINIDSQYLIYNTISLEEFYNNEYLNYLNLLRRTYDLFLLINNNYSQHCNIRNYKTIISNINYSKLDIVEIFILPTNESIACLKTFWIRIFQRKWKTLFKLRREKIKYLRNSKNLRKREISGIIKCFNC